MVKGKWELHKKLEEGSYSPERHQCVKNRTNDLNLGWENPWYCGIHRTPLVNFKCPLKDKCHNVRFCRESELNHMEKNPFV